MVCSPDNKYYQRDIHESGVDHSVQIYEFSKKNIQKTH